MMAMIGVALLIDEARATVAEIAVQLGLSRNLVGRKIKEAGLEPAAVVRRATLGNQSQTVRVYQVADVTRAVRQPKKTATVAATADDMAEPPQLAFGGGGLTFTATELERLATRRKGLRV